MNLKTAAQAPFVCSILLFCASSSPHAWAQTAPADAPQTLRRLLQKAAYDPNARGPLLVVAPDEPAPPPRTGSDEGSGDEADATEAHSDAVPSLGALARRVDRRVARIGGVTVLAPRQMMHIETDPAKANPFKNMQKSDSIKLLMGTLTPAQWQMAGSATGISMGDLDKDQQLLFDSLLPSGKIELQKMVVEAGEEPNSKTYKTTDTISIADRNSVHLRLNRETQILLHATTENMSYIAGNNDAVGQTSFFMHGDYTEDPSTYDRSQQFGVKLAYLISNRQKPSQLDYSEVALNTRISLTGLSDSATLGDLITRVAAATHIDIVPERRIRSLPVYVRGDSARAGDLLQAIAFCVTGTYRRIGESETYLLTDDVKGIGVRITRLAQWAQAAQSERQKVIEDAMKHAAGQDPLQYLAYAPGDPLALPPSRIAHIDDDNRNNRYNDSDVSLNDLAPAFQNAAQQSIDYWQAQQNVSLRADKVGLQMSLGINFVFPGVGAVSGNQAGIGMDFDSLRRLAAAPDKTTPSGAPQVAAPAHPSTAPALDWTWLQTPRQRRVLVFAPANAADSAAFVVAAHRHGFNEVWIKVTLGNTKASRAILEAALDAAKPVRMPVYAVVSLLQNDGLEGQPERTIGGQTGERYISAQRDFLQQTEPGEVQSEYFMRNFIEHYTGWIDPDRDDLLRHVSALADTPEVAGLVFRGTAPPGFVRSSTNYDSGVQPGGEMGYTDARRVALVHAEGTDPIDVRPSQQGYLGGANIDLPFFSDKGQEYKYVNGKYIPDPDFVSLAMLWENFRVGENEALLRDVYGKIHALRPDFPLLIDDRISDYANVNVSWFGSWDNAARLPKNAPYTNSGAAAAHTTSHSVLLNFTIPKYDPTEAKGRFASAVSRTGAVSVSQKWDGVVFDFSAIPRDMVLNLLDLVPAPSTSK